MPVEQREQVIHIKWSQRETGGTPCLDGGRQPSLGGTSRMNREVHVRICGRLGVQFPGPTRQSLGPTLPHICARSRKGKFTVHVRTMKKRLRRGLTAIAEWCQEHRHEPVEQQQQTLNTKLRGHYQYYGLPTNSRSLWQFYREVCSIWRKWLSRRTRGTRLTWEKYKALLRRYPLSLPRIIHSWNGVGSSA
jgi:hypothetical protein